jgi:hypothetical protein
VIGARITSTVRGKSRPNVVKPVVYRSLHRWWVPLVSIAGAIMTPAGASAHEIGRKGGSAVAVGITRDAPGAAAGEILVLNKGRLDTALRPDEPAAASPCSGACTDHHPMPVDPDRHANAALCHGTRETLASRLGSHRPVGGARSEPTLPLHSHKHRIAFPKFGRANDPNDDGTSRDPSDDETSDDYAASDGTDLPIAVWLRDLVRCSINLVDQSAPTWIEIPSAPPLSRHHLRC